MYSIAFTTTILLLLGPSSVSLNLNANLISISSRHSGFFGGSSTSIIGVASGEVVSDGEGGSDANGLVMRISRRGSKMRGQDFSVSKLNEERKANSGKKGSR